MNAKKLSLVLMLPALLILGAGCGPAAPAAPGSTPAAAVNQEENLNSTPIEMLSSGKSLECTFTSEPIQKGVQMIGTYFVDGRQGKFRMDAQANVGGTNLKTYLVGDKESIYSWSDASGKTGFKMAVDTTAKADKTAGTQDTSGVDAKMDFKCKGWTPDDAKFALPADVKFMDLDATK